MAPDGEELQKRFRWLNCPPWFPFNAASHAILEPHQTMPLVNWGKFKNVNGKKIMAFLNEKSETN